MKFQVLDVDPPWGDWSDNLTMNKVKRGAKSQYKSIMTLDDIKALKVSEIAAKDSVLALWCPSSMVQDGLNTMKAWDFDFKQTWIWVKTKKIPLTSLLKQLKTKDNIAFYDNGIIKNFDINEILAFGMGHLFRQTHEVCLIGKRGKVYSKLKDKSQRSVYFYPATKHSTKPEGLQDMLEKMFKGNKAELFSRRHRKHWVGAGNELAITKDEDIKVSISKMARATTKDLKFLDNPKYSEQEKFEMWAKLPV